MNKPHANARRENAEPPSPTRISYILILAALSTYLVVGCIGLASRDWRLVSAVGGASVLLILPFWLLRSGRSRTGAFILMVIVLGTVTGMATLGQGIRDIAIVAFPIVFIYAGMTMDRVILGLCGGLTLIATLWLAFGEVFGWFAPVPPSADPLNLTALALVTVLLLVSIVAVDLLASNMRRSLVQARQQSAERQTADAALRESNDLFSEFVSHSPIYAFIKEVTPTGSRVIRASENFKDMIGIAGSEMAGKDMNALFPAEIAARMTADDQDVVASGKVLEIDEDLNGRHYHTIKFPITRSDTTYLAGYTIDITERMRNQTKLRQSEETFRAFYKANPVPTYTWRQDGDDLVLVDYSIAAVSITQGAVEKLVGTKLSQMFKDDPAVLEDVRRCLQEKSVIMRDMEYKFHFNGDVKFLHVKYAYVPPDYVMIYTEDFTEIERAIAALKKSHGLLTESQQIGKVGGWEFNIDTRESIWTEEVCRIHEVDVGFNPTVDQGIGFYAPSSRPRIERAVQRAVEHAEAYDIDLEIITAKGNRRHVNAIGRADLEHRRVYGFFQDITERKRAEEALQESERKFRSAFMTGTDASYLATLEEGLILEVNDNFVRVFGYSREEAVGRTSLELGLYADPADRVRLVNELKATGEVRDLELQACKKRGEIRTVSLSISTLDLNNRRHILGVARDITERKQAEQVKVKMEAQLQQAQKMESVGRLAGGVAHDFNNMLQVISSYLEILLKDPAVTDDQRHNLAQVREAARRSADLTSRLLAFARGQEANPRILDLNEAVEKALKMLRRLIGEDIELVWKPGSLKGSVKVDPAQLDQVLANLAVNSRDAIDGVGALILESSEEILDESYCLAYPECLPGRYVLLTVSDTGTGMSPEVQARIFDPFFTTKPVGKGTGLGLPSVYGVVKQNGGHISVSSALGHGTSFRIYLPSIVGAGIPEVDEAPTDLAPRGGNETILLVEDEEAILEVSRLILAELGYRVLTAATPEAAIREMESNPGGIDLLVTDVIMPQMNGRELFRRLALRQPGMKCLYVSGYAADVIGKHGMLEKGVHFLSKPYATSRLAAKIREMLDASTEAG